MNKTKKEQLLELFKTCTDPYITLSIISPDMEHSEYLTVFRADYETKSEVINRDYNDNLELYRNTNVKIDAVLALAIVENDVYIY